MNYTAVYGDVVLNENVFGDFNRIQSSSHKCVDLYFIVCDWWSVIESMP